MSLKLKVKSYGWDGGGGSCVVSPSPKNWALCSFIIVLIGECWNEWDFGLGLTVWVFVKNLILSYLINRFLLASRCTDQ